jgi:hypothetical protein
MLETTNGVDELDQLPPLRTSVPGQRTETPAPDHDCAFLLAVIGLARTGAPEPALADAVKRARDNGWTWTPLGRAIGHPVTRHRSCPPA